MKDVGFGFWASLTNLELENILRYPQGYPCTYRAFAAQELSNRGIKNDPPTDTVSFDFGNGRDCYQ